LIREELPQSGADHRMVINNGNSNHGVTSIDVMDDPTIAFGRK
jgi:hypothetical protein